MTEVLSRAVDGAADDQHSSRSVQLNPSTCLQLLLSNISAEQFPCSFREPPWNREFVIPGREHPGRRFASQALSPAKVGPSNREADRGWPWRRRCRCSHRVNSGRRRRSRWAAGPEALDKRSTLAASGSGKVAAQSDRETRIPSRPPEAAGQKSPLEASIRRSVRRSRSCYGSTGGNSDAGGVAGCIVDRPRFRAERDGPPMLR